MFLEKHYSKTKELICNHNNMVDLVRVLIYL
jgi:hypothetical protein